MESGWKDRRGEGRRQNERNEPGYLRGEQRNMVKTRMGAAHCAAPTQI